MHEPPASRQLPAWPAASRVSRARSSFCSSSLKALSSSGSAPSRAQVSFRLGPPPGVGRLGDARPPVVWIEVANNESAGVEPVQE